MNFDHHSSIITHHSPIESSLLAPVGFLGCCFGDSPPAEAGSPFSITWRQKNEEASSAGRSQGRSVLRLGQFHPGECAHYDRSVDCSLPPGSDERYGEESLGTMKNPDPPEAGFNLPAPFCSSPPNARFGSHESTVLTGVSVANGGLMFNTCLWPLGEVALEGGVGVGVGTRKIIYRAM